MTVESAREHRPKSCERGLAMLRVWEKSARLLQYKGSWQACHAHEAAQRPSLGSPRQNRTTTKRFCPGGFAGCTFWSPGPHTPKIVVIFTLSSSTPRFQKWKPLVGVGAVGKWVGRGPGTVAAAVATKPRKRASNPSRPSSFRLKFLRSPASPALDLVPCCPVVAFPQRCPRLWQSSIAEVAKRERGTLETKFPSRWTHPLLLVLPPALLSFPQPLFFCHRIWNRVLPRLGLRASFPPSSPSLPFILLHWMDAHSLSLPPFLRSCHFVYVSDMNGGTCGTWGYMWLHHCSYFFTSWKL